MQTKFVSKARERLIQLWKSPKIGGKAFQQLNIILNPYYAMPEKVRVFHDVFGIPVRDTPTELSVEDRYRRLMLTFEEFAETATASGFRFAITMSNGHEIIIHDVGSIRLKHIPGSKQDLVEIADGIGDQLVTNIGHALEHGFDIEAVFAEIMLSNMTKLDESGKAIINQCQFPGPGEWPKLDFNGAIPESFAQCDHKARTGECNYAPHFLRPDLPKGKILKPDSYIPADVAGVLATKIL